MKGIVKWYNARKGYGFITPDDKGNDVFVHAITLKSCGLNKLFTGSEVTFDVEEDEKGKRAKNLKVTKEVKPETEIKKGKPEIKKTEEKKEKPETKKTEEKKEKTPDKTKPDKTKPDKTKNEKAPVSKEKKSPAAKKPKKKASGNKTKSKKK